MFPSANIIIYALTSPNLATDIGEKEGTSFRILSLGRTHECTQWLGLLLIKFQNKCVIL